MRYESPPKELFIENRKRFSDQMVQNSVAVFNSNDILPTSADGTMPFIQQSDMYYLSGIDQEESILVLFPDSSDTVLKEALFIKETSQEIAIWEGEKLSQDQAKEISGIQSVYWLSQFESIFSSMVFQAKTIYLNSNEHLRASRIVQTRDDRFANLCKEKYPHHKYERSQPILHDLRPVKSEAEIAQLQRAIDITELAFRRVLGFIEPGTYEFEIEAEMIHEFVRNGSRRFAFQPIIASGYNACVLHYIENKDMCRDGTENFWVYTGFTY